MKMFHFISRFEDKKELLQDVGDFSYMKKRKSEFVSLCVCVGVCERERERGGKVDSYFWRDKGGTQTAASGSIDECDVERVEEVWQRWDRLSVH